MNHADFRQTLSQAFWQRVGRAGTRPELQLCHAVAILETSEGEGWHGPGVGSFNMGAIQAYASWHGDSFVYTDTHPNADGTNTPYRIAFRKYPTAVAGCADLVDVVYFGAGGNPRVSRSDVVLRPAGRGDDLGFSTGLHASGYYEGFGATVADRIANHHAAVLRALHALCADLHEPMPDGSDPVPEAPVRPTLRLGAHGPAVADLQRALQIAADGAFGSGTLAALLAFQKAHGLKPDGIAGPATYAALGLS